MGVLALITCICCLARLGRTEQLPIQSYNAGDGLSDNHINRIRQDSSGFLWFATDSGLSRFDGYAFTNYTTAHGLPHQWVNDIIETHNGDYWIATDGGVCRFNGSKPSSSSSAFACYSPSSSKDARRVNALLEEHSGLIWCATYDGIYRLEISQTNPIFRHVDINAPSAHEGSQVNNLLLDRHGDLWASVGSGLYRRRLLDDRWEHYGIAHGLPDLYVETLLEDRDGRLWAGTRHAGVCLLVAQPDPAHRVVERCFSVRDGLPANDVRSIVQTSDGQRWIGTVSGLSRFGIEGHIRTYDTSNGLSDATIYKLAEDREGNLWIGTKHGGVMKLDYHGFVAYGQAEGFRSGEYSSSIFETHLGQLCVTSGEERHRYLQCLEANRFSAVDLPISSSVLARGWGWQEPVLQDRDEAWWVPTAQGLLRFASVRRPRDLTSAKPRPTRMSGFDLASANIGRIYQDPEGNIWIPASNNYSNELIRWSRFTGAFDRATHLIGDKRNIASAFTRDRAGGLWIGFHGNEGLVRCSTSAISGCQTITDRPRGDIYALYTDSLGRVWAASSAGGLARFDYTIEAGPHFVSYTSDSGLSNNEVWCIAEDRWGRIYAGTASGLDRLDPKTGLITHFTAADGLSPGRIQAAYCDRNGTMWFASHRAVSRLDPISPSVVPPLVRITSVRVDGIVRTQSDLSENRTSKLRLASSENSLEVSFVDLSFTGGRRVRYQYLVEGLDSKWSPPTDARSALFPRLSPGSYRFSVRAIGPDGVASSPASMAFSIAQPLWRHWWFILATVGALALSAWALHRHQLSRLLEMERVRGRIATDLHDEIGSSLSRMAILSEVVQRQLGPTVPEDSIRLLNEIADSARTLMSGMSDVVWSIDPRRDDLASLAVRVREFASDIFAASGVEWQFLTPSTLDHAALDPGQRRELFLIYKESITNVVRHSSCSIARLSLEHSGGRLTAEVQDNGCGFSVNGQRGRGLDNIESRARRLGGSCEIASAPNQGTRITVIVPLR